MPEVVPTQVSNKHLVVSAHSGGALPKKQTIFDSDDESTKQTKESPHDESILAELKKDLEEARSRLQVVSQQLQAKEQELDELKSLLERATAQVQTLQDVRLRAQTRNRLRVPTSTVCSRRRETTG